MGAGWHHKSGLLHRRFPPNSQKKKAALQASVTACSFNKTNKALGPTPLPSPTAHSQTETMKTALLLTSSAKCRGMARVSQAFVQTGCGKGVGDPGKDQGHGPESRPPKSICRLSLSSFLPFSFLPSFPPSFRYCFPFVFFPSSFL